MPTLTEIRKKYPEYDRVSDDVLAEALYKKHYSDRPREVFNKAIGYTPQQKPDLQSSEYRMKLFNEALTNKPVNTNIAEDIQESILGLPGTAYNVIASAPSEIGGAALMGLTDPKKFGKEIATGVGEAGVGAINLAPNVLNYFLRKGGVGKQVPTLDVNVADYTGVGEVEPGSGLLRGSASFIPFLGAAGKIGKLGNISRPLQVAGAGAAQAASQNQDPLQAALLAGTMEKGISKIGAKNPLSMKNMVENLEIPLEQVKKNAAVAGDTNTPLGSIIESPSLKELQENVLAPIPFSGVKESFQKTGKDIVKKGEDLVQSLAEGKKVPEDIPESLMKSIQSQAKEVTAKKDKLFQLRNERAEELGLTTKRERFRNEAQKLLSQVEQDPITAALQNPADINFLKKIVGNEGFYNYDYSTGAKIHPDYSLNSPVLLKELGDRAYEAYLNHDRRKAEIFTKLKTSLEKDINSVIESSNDPVLQDRHADAYYYYDKEFNKYNKPEVQKILKGDLNSDELISKYLKTGGRTDRAKKIDELKKIVPPDQRQFIAYDYYSNAFDDRGLNVPKLKNLHKQLGDRQKEALLKPEQLKQMNDFVRLAEMNPEAFSTMFNVKNGSRTLAMIAMAGGGAGGAIGTMVGGILGSIGGAAVGAGLTTPISIMIARKLNTKLNDPGFRKMVISEIEKQQNKPLSNNQKQDIIVSLRNSLGHETDKTDEVNVKK